ncbi:MAG TPA: glutathione S-transferase N-terminal domain-containing protein [Gaiellaceae bacterium]|jgi:glutathione S-transferase|nr:glutathione S-transferase N-terminal domain-containing protein [Gaiellaceae bacterium]
MKLWYRPGSAAMAPHIALAEIGCDYELAAVPHDAPDEAGEDYRRLNPQGRVPVLEDGGLVLTESAAIVMYLADEHPEARLLAEVGSRERAEAYRWLVFLTNTVQEGFLRFFYPERYVDEPGVESLRSRQAEALAVHFDRIDAELEGRDWLAGGAERSAADLYLFMLTRWGRRLDPPAWDLPHLRAHFQRLLGRPPIRRVLDEQGLEIPAL